MNRRSFIKTGLIYVPTAAIVPACLADRRRAQFQSKSSSAASEQNWITSYTPNLSSTGGWKGWKITVGASNVVVTKLLCWFKSAGVTFADVPMRIQDSGLNVVASGTIPIAGSTENAWNEVDIADYTMTASGTYYILGQFDGSNGYDFFSTVTENTTVATKVFVSDETGTDTAQATIGISFKHQ